MTSTNSLTVVYISNKQEPCRAPNKIEPTTRRTRDPSWPNKIRQTLTIWYYIRSRPSTPSWDQSKKFNAAPLSEASGILPKRSTTPYGNYIMQNTPQMAGPAISRPKKNFPSAAPHHGRVGHSQKILCNANESDHIRWPKQAKWEYKHKKEISDSYDVILMELKATLERVIDKAYHTTGNTGIMGDGFGQLIPFKILQRLQKTYERANIQEIEAKLLHLNNPMDRKLPVEVMIRDIEDVHRFLLANPSHNMELTEVQLCTHGMIKLSKTGGLYENTTKRWNLKDRAIRQQWMEFKTHFIDEYKNAPQKCRNNHGPRGIWNKRGI